MLFNGRALIFTFSGTQVRIAEIERLQSLFKVSMHRAVISKSSGVFSRSYIVTISLVCCSLVAHSVQDIVVWVCLRMYRFKGGADTFSDLIARIQRFVFSRNCSLQLKIPYPCNEPKV